MMTMKQEKHILLIVSSL